MIEWSPAHRAVLAVLAVLLLGGIGFGVRQKTALPPVAFVQGEVQSARPLVSPGRFKSRHGGASPSAEKPGEPQTIVVHVAGAVKKPGVYSLPPGKRIVDAIHAAGGPTRNVDLDALNLAAKLGDGQQVMVERKGRRVVSSAGGTASSSRRSASKAAAAPRMVSVNTASVEELDLLPGVGPSTAQKIIDYRNQNGPFRSPQDLLNVKGTGPKKLAKMQPYLLIN